MSGSSFITVSIDPDPGFTFDFDRMRGSEELGRLFQFDLEVSSKTPKADLTSLLGGSATVTITKSDKTSKRHFNGIIARAYFDGLVRGAYRYRLELRPYLWLLSRMQDCRIYQNKTVFEVITGAIRDAGFTNISDKRQNQAGSQTLEYCVQFNETTLDFVTRLMEVYGLYFYFTHESGQHTLVIADDPNSHSSIGAALKYEYKQTEFRATEEHVWNWVSEQELQPGVATFRDYNFTTSAADLTSKALKQGTHAQHASLEIYEYPGPYGATDDGTKIADVRAQRFAVDRQNVQGTSNSRELYTGCKFSVSGFTDSSQNREYTMIAAKYVVEQAEGVQSTEGDLADTFRCEFTAIPGDTQFRLDCKTRWPVMRGPQTAKVVGESGEEITTDQYGRIKVQFYWDRLGTNDQNSSCWVRVAQIWAGAGWGGIYIPRIGQEVVVDFLDGSPDRPIVTGCVYNNVNTLPYGLPDNKTRSTIKTNSTTGGGGFNELRFEDKKDNEEVFFQAQKDYNKVVLNNETVKITQDTTTTVEKGNRSVTVSEGNNSLTVSKGTNTTTVSEGDNALTVSQGKNTVTVGQGDNELTVSQGKNTVTVSTGDNVLTVSTGNNTTTVSTGNDSLAVKAGNHSITVNAGSSTLKAGQAITIQSMQSITLKVAASSIIIDATGVTIKGPKLTLNANAEMEANGGGMMTLKAGLITIN